MYKEIYELYKELDKHLVVIQNRMLQIDIVKKQLRDAITTEQRLLKWADISHKEVKNA